MRVPLSPNQSANPCPPWEAEPVAEESGAIEDANAENLYLMGRVFLVTCGIISKMWYKDTSRVIVREASVQLISFKV